MSFPQPRRFWVTLHCRQQRDNISVWKRCSTFPNPPLPKRPICVEIDALARWISLRKSIRSITAIYYKIFRCTCSKEYALANMIGSPRIRMTKNSNSIAPGRSITCSTCLLSTIMFNVILSDNIEARRSRWQGAWCTKHTLCFVLIPLQFLSTTPLVPVTLLHKPASSETSSIRDTG